MGVLGIRALQASTPIRFAGLLRILLDEKNETGPELFAELDSDCFRLEDGAIGYLVQLSPGGSLGVNKTENGNIIGGAAFGRSWG